MKRLSLIFGFLLLCASFGWSQQISWEPVETLTLSEILDESMLISLRLGTLSEMDYQTYLSLKQESTALQKQIGLLEVSNANLTALVVDLRNSSSALETRLQKAESLLTVSIDSTERLQKEAKRLKTNLYWQIPLAVLAGIGVGYGLAKLGG